MKRYDQSEIRRLAMSLKEAKLDEANLLDRIARAAEHSSASVSSGIELASKAEKNFLESKVLTSMIVNGEKPSTYDYKAMGTTVDFPCFLSYEDGVYMFYLPPTPSVKIGQPGPNAGRHTGYLVKNLIRSFEAENGKIDMLTSPVIVLEYGFPADRKRARYYDADNRDNKRILDAMTGTFYPDDNVMEIMTIHKGVITDRECTRVHVMEMEELSHWICKNYQR